MLQEIKVYTIDAMSSNSMKSSNPHSGIHETQIAKCLDTMCLDPGCNQGGIMICKPACVVYDGSSVTSPKNWNNPQPGDPCYALHTDSRNYVVISMEGNGSRESHQGKSFSEDGVMYTLNTIERHSVCYEKQEYNLLTKQLQTSVNIANTLEATDYKEPQSICYSIDCRNLYLNEEKTGTLQAKNIGGFSYNYLPPVLMVKQDE